MSTKNPLVTTYFQNAKKWQEEMIELRKIVLECEVTEEMKWNKPCYTYEGGNIAIIAPLKESATLNFFKGALLKDPKKILTQPGENSQSGRRIKFTSMEQIAKLKPTIQSYIREAIELEKSGAKIEIRREPIVITEELGQEFAKNPALQKAFLALTEGRQRAYIMFFNQAKQSATRTSRIQQYTKKILCGKGMNDCVCGHSKRMPNCDGSHKEFGGKNM